MPLRRNGRVALSAIRNSQFQMVRASFPVFILGWTVGAFGVWPSRSDAMTIARHFNAGFNPQSIPSPGGTTGFSKMKSCAKCGDDLSFVQPSRWDWWPCASTPALKRRAIVGLSLPGRAQADLSRSPQFAIRNSKWSGLLFRFSVWDGRQGRSGTEQSKRDLIKSNDSLGWLCSIFHNSTQVHF